MPSNQHVPRVKRNATFRVDLVLSQDEWAAISPWDSVSAKIKQGDRRYDLTVTANAPARTLTLTFNDPAEWRRTMLGGASFDVWFTRGNERLPVPASHNIEFTIVEGASG